MLYRALAARHRNRHLRKPDILTLTCIALCSDYDFEKSAYLHRQARMSLRHITKISSAWSNVDLCADTTGSECNDESAHLPAHVCADSPES